MIASITSTVPPGDGAADDVEAAEVETAGWLDEISPLEIVMFVPCVYVGSVTVFVFQVVI